GVEEEYYQGNTGVSGETGVLRCLFLNREVPRRRRFTYEYEGVLARCGAYFERVCRRVPSLRQDDSKETCFPRTPCSCWLLRLAGRRISASKCVTGGWEHGPGQATKTA